MNSCSNQILLSLLKDTLELATLLTGVAAAAGAAGAGILSHSGYAGYPVGEAAKLGAIGGVLLGAVIGAVNNVSKRKGILTKEPKDSVTRLRIMMVLCTPALVAAGLIGYFVSGTGAITLEKTAAAFAVGGAVICSLEILTAIKSAAAFLQHNRDERNAHAVNGISHLESHHTNFENRNFCSKQVLLSVLIEAVALATVLAGVAAAVGAAGAGILSCSGYEGYPAGEAAKLGAIGAALLGIVIGAVNNVSKYKEILTEEPRDSSTRLGIGTAICIPVLVAAGLLGYFVSGTGAITLEKTAAAFAVGCAVICTPYILAAIKHIYFSQSNGDEDAENRDYVSLGDSPEHQAWLMMSSSRS